MPEHQTLTDRDASFPSRQPHLKDYLRIIVARRWLLASTSVIVVLSVVVWVLVQTPVYRARARLLIEPSKVNLTEFKQVYDPTMTQAGGQLSRREFYETQYRLIVADSVLQKTFQKFSFAKEAGFRDMEDPIEAFGKLFGVNPERGSRLVEVTFDWKDPELAARVLDFQVQEYIAEYRQRALGVTTGGLEELAKKAEELKPELEDKRGELQDFMVKYNMVSLEKTQNILVDRLKEINRMLSGAERQKIECMSICQNIEEALVQKSPLEDMPEIADSDTIRDLKLEYIRTKQDMKDLQGRFGDNHPEIVSTEAKLKAITEKLYQEMTSILAATRAEFERIKTQEGELRRQLEEQQKRVMEFNRRAVEYNFLKSSYQSLERTYTAIITRIEEIEIALAAGSKGDNIFIISHPEVPVYPAKPRKKMAVLLACFVGLALGGSLCFFVDYLDTTIKTKEDVQRIIDAPVVGYVPAVHDGQVPSEDGDLQPPELMALEKPRSPLAESFRSIRTALAFSKRGEELKRVLVTSALPQEGKSLVSVNLAIALARAGKKVLLADADMRKPRLHRILRLPASPGLSNLLSSEGTVSIDQAVQAVADVANLSFLGSGHVPPNPSELLSGNRLVQLIDELDTRFDMVIFDTPPVINVSDAVVLSHYVQGTLLVMRTFCTQRDFARYAAETFEQSGGEILGVILNTVDVPPGGYYAYDPYYRYSHSGYYYYYGAESAGKGRKRRKRRGSRSRT